MANVKYCILLKKLPIKSNQCPFIDVYQCFLVRATLLIGVRQVPRLLLHNAHSGAHPADILAAAVPHPGPLLLVQQALVTPAGTPSLPVIRGRITFAQLWPGCDSVPGPPGFSPHHSATAVHISLFCRLARTSLVRAAVSRSYWLRQAVVVLKSLCLYQPRLLLLYYLLFELE